MIGANELVSLLGKYGIDRNNTIKSNSHITRYGEYNNIEKIIEFLLDKGVSIEGIEKCPNILFGQSFLNVRNVYYFLVNDTKLNNLNIDDCLKILCSDFENVKLIYNYVLNKYGLDVLVKCPTILSGNYLNIVEITRILEETIGLDIVKNNGGSILCEAKAEEISKILFIPEFEYDDVNKTYNREFLTLTALKISYRRIKKILSLSYWKDDRFKKLLAPNIFKKSVYQIKEILELEYWEDERFLPLLTSNIWGKDAFQIRKILELEHWKDEKFKKTLGPTIWLKDVRRIEEILELDCFEDKRFDKLLTPSIWQRDAMQITQILSLDCLREDRFSCLLTPTIWHSNAKRIEEILNLSYWKESKFQKLLGPTIWLKSVYQIKEILELEYWEDERYQTLLTPTIWYKDASHIKTNIEICLNNGLEEFIGNPTLVLRLSSNELISKINYLKYNNIPLFYKNKNGNLRLSNIFSMSNINMQKEYGISKKELIRDYLSIEKGKKKVLS